MRKLLLEAEELNVLRSVELRPLTIGGEGSPQMQEIATRLQSYGLLYVFLGGWRVSAMGHVALQQTNHLLEPTSVAVWLAE